MSRFDDCLPFILKMEGGYVNNPNDRGGATNKGIIQITYDVWRNKHELPLRPVKDIGEDEVHDIYKEMYWTDLPIPLDILIFDSAIQHGKGRAIKWLQNLVGTKADGLCGMNTKTLVNQYILRFSMEKLLTEYLGVRRNFYAAIIARDSSQQVFAKGWANRMKGIEEQLK